ncbi:hypothetical protein TNCV_4829691 [Trichonephila clavipes]|nr:hypothetical protein TNCV_4829691 [Trichonephila clavipes]
MNVTKSVVSVATIAGCNHFHRPWYRIKEALDISLGYSNPCRFRILPKLIWCSSGGVSRASLCASIGHTFSIGD